MVDNRHEWREGRINYQAFILRCWQDGNSLTEREPDPRVNWHFVLVQVDDGSQSRCFATLEELVVYLRGRLDQVAQDGANSAGDSLDRPPGKKPGSAY